MWSVTGTIARIDVFGCNYFETDSLDASGRPTAGTTWLLRDWNQLREADMLKWWIVLIASISGVGFTTIQILEKVAILSNPDGALFCDINAAVSCTNVLNAWQSSVLGPPNSLIGAIMFAIFLSAALAGLTRSTLSKGYVATLLGLAIFFALFATWFMFQTAFVIGSLCLWCTGIMTAVLAIAWALTRAMREVAPDSFVATAVHARLDAVVFVGWWLGIAAMLYVGLG